MNIMCFRSIDFQLKTVKYIMKIWNDVYTDEYMASIHDTSQLIKYFMERDGSFSSHQYVAWTAKKNGLSVLKLNNDELEQYKIFLEKSKINGTNICASPYFFLYKCFSDKYYQKLHLINKYESDSDRILFKSAV